MPVRVEGTEPSTRTLGYFATIEPRNLKLPLATV